ncbi:L-seryl-tRNA(Sec) selenium transferase [Helicobacter sp. 13S00477-4]|uniref:L-seryl-tRNA(Sec) selenium transferase n=1 Tax=Helicobacter sp. 13S00477-4 TaxID=1905759 RepID=UPI000BA52B16|nr:L-seryl-tRNA(Sec) selenium transferase [Helicobacter sp. 13S00477-4]PAF51952.1 L-seryl-tRNA(Sec) selenium transferase [Helicobacter sp. 13S00477-4]
MPLLSQLPQVDKILKEKRFEAKNHIILKKIIQDQIALLRQNLIDSKSIPDYENILQNIQKSYEQLHQIDSKPLINATGIVIQTNLGRSIFSPKLLVEIFPLLSQYNNLEYDTSKGIRADRYKSIKKYICTLFDCEDTIIVNNNASAILLIINTFAKNKEVIISRGELIEIGGSFRIPEIILSAGGILKEIGSTNKTHLKDYENAITQNSTLILKAHQSNFKQIGFTHEVALEQIITLAKNKGVIDYYDVGSGYIAGIEGINEPSLIEISKLKPSLVSFSGDKLLGGPQAGIIFGKKPLIDQLKKNHLLRALRIDKFSIFALEATLRAYMENNFELIPTISMLKQSPQTLQDKAKKLFEKLSTIQTLQCKLITVKSKAGGGSLPEKEFPSYGLSLKHNTLKTTILNTKIRQKGLIARIQNDCIILDIRCIKTSSFKTIKNIFSSIDNEK